jgi:hypothetical protein
VAEREHAAVGPVIDLDIALGHKPLDVENLLIVAAELPDGLARQRTGAQLGEIFLSHLHRRYEIDTAADG